MSDSFRTKNLIDRFDALIHSRCRDIVAEEDPRKILTKQKQALLTLEIAKTIFTYNSTTGEVSWLPGSSSGRGTHLRVGNGSTSGKYITFTFNGKIYLAHRLAWLLHYGEWPKLDIDHIDRNTFNNKISNLREVTNAINHANRGDNKSGSVGVIFEKSRGLWKAYVRVGYVMHNIGRFASKEEAEESRLLYIERLQCLGYLTTYTPEQ